MWTSCHVRNVYCLCTLKKKFVGNIAKSTDILIKIIQRVQYDEVLYHIAGFRGGKYLFFSTKSDFCVFFSFLLHQRHSTLQSATPIL